MVGIFGVESGVFFPHDHSGHIRIIKCFCAEPAVYLSLVTSYIL